MRFLVLLLGLSAAVNAFSATHRDWQGLRQQIRTTLHIPEPLPSLESKSYDHFTPASGVTADRISYATDYGLRVPAIVYHPAGATIAQHPALVVVNGHGGDKSSWYAYWAGILYARAGAVVLTYDPIGEYERNALRESNTLQHDEIIPPEDMARRMGGLMITDVMQAVNYLAERRDVDPKRIGVMGYSMGSFISSIACAIDTRVHVCVLVGGGDLDGPGGYWDGSRKMCQAIPYQSLKFLGDRGAILYALNAKRGPTLVFNGSADGVVDIPHHGEDFFADLRKRTIAEVGTSKDVFGYEFAPGGGHRPYFVTKPVALWLEDKLKFRDWTRKQIQAMPETNVLDWAVAHNLNPPGSSVTNPDGEGGTLALSTDIPAVPRADLHAIPEAVWDSQRDRYVYETWVDHAKVAISSGAP
ncbi:MAG TPA: prolyl oligopeptidase family serine peptidase [Bryobacteraceae bacterium]|nr:prolyl oligopeptidase family serine peptidase [Bryobacteraceae bacterium]